MPTILIGVALVLGGIELVKSRAQSLLAWGLSLLALALFWPHI